MNEYGRVVYQPSTKHSLCLQCLMSARPRICCLNLSLETAARRKQGSSHTWQLSQAHTGSRVAVPFKQPCAYHDVTKLSLSSQKSYKIMRMKMFIIWVNPKPNTHTALRGLHLAAVKFTDVQRPKLTLLHKLSQLRRALLYRSGRAQAMNTYPDHV